MRRVLIDTNVLLRFILNDIPSQADLVEKLFNDANAKRVELVVPQIIIFEVTFALEKYYAFEKNLVIDRVQSLLSARFLNIQDKDLFNSALGIFKSSNISLVDAFLKAECQAMDLELVSFDKKLLKV